MVPDLGRPAGWVRYGHPSMGPLALALMTLMGGAQAQEPARSVVPDVGAVAPAAGEWTWERVSPFTLGRLSDVAVDTEGGFVTVTRDGAVWASRQGELWEEEHPGFGAGGLALSSDEEVILGIEVRVQELMEDFDGGAFADLGTTDSGSDDAESDVEDAVAQLADGSASEAASEAGDQVQTELVSDPWFLEGAEGPASRAFVVRPRLVSGADALWLARGDGLWRRGALRWTSVLEQATTAVAMWRGTWIAATLGGGLLSSSDGESWAPAAGPPVEHVFDLVTRKDGTLIAGTDDGLWASIDGAGFARLGPLAEPVVRLVTDGDRLWVVTSDAVWRSDDGGQTLVTTSGDRTQGVQDVVGWAGGVLVSTGKAVWRSRDSGETWSPLSDGLGAVAARGMVVRDGVPLVATDVGLYRLREGAQTLPLAMADWVPLGHLMASAAMREEFQQRFGNRLAASFVPSVTLDGWLMRSDSLLYQPEVGTDRFIDNNLYVGVQLQWTPQGRRTYDADDFAMGADLADSAPAVLISASGAVAVLDESALRVGGSTLSRDSVAYRGELAGEISALYRARARLVSEAPESEELRGRVLREIERLELEALMDALSGGAVARWQVGRTTEGS
ncbi:MAG: hypothetical protein ACI8PZ_000639 [Myxococcota bacterium]|jgi:hypothetical protein